MKPRPRKLSDVEAVQRAIMRNLGLGSNGWARATIACLRRRGWRKVGRTMTYREIANAAKLRSKDVFVMTSATLEATRKAMKAIKKARDKGT